MTDVTDGPIDERPVLHLDDVKVHFPITSPVLRRTVGHVQAVDGVSLDVPPGRTVALVGESGSGKSTLGRVALRLVDPTAGRVVLDGTDITELSPSKLRPLRRSGQMVFQDPYSSFDPRAPIGESVAEPLRTHFDMTKGERRQRVGDLLEQVQLRREHMHRYPFEFSGGQLQRIALARALAVEPKLIVADEPVSSLDVSTQARVLGLLRSLQDELGVAYLFISHDLSVVRHISELIAVMYLGRVIEVGRTEDVCARPAHPYTHALMSAVPVPDPTTQRSRKRIVLSGEIPSPSDPPSGCRFHTRCPYVMDVCRSVDPPAYVTGTGLRVHCHLHTTGPELAGASVSELAARTAAAAPAASGSASAASPVALRTSA